MARKRSALSVRAKRVEKNAKPISDNQIDFSDIPESTDEELKRAKRVGRPTTGKAKQLIAIRIDPKLLAILRKIASEQDKPYQTLIHELLEKAAKKAA
jgi:predicted DNA binding CopG/RHH family protein